MKNGNEFRKDCRQLIAGAAQKFDIATRTEQLAVARYHYATHVRIGIASYCGIK